MHSIDLMARVAYSHIKGLTFRAIETYLDIPKSTAHRWCTQYSCYFENINEVNDKINDKINDDKVNDKNDKINDDKINDKINGKVNDKVNDTVNDNEVDKVSKIIDIIVEKKEEEMKENKAKELNDNKDIINFIKKSLSIQPFQTLYKLQGKIKKKFNTDLSIKIISKYVKIARFSKKKITRRLYNNDLKKHKLNRSQFRKKIKTIPQEDIICLDETGVNRNTYSKYGYSKLGKRLVAYYSVKNIPIKNSILMAIDNKKIVGHVIQTKSFNGISFTEFVKQLISDNQYKGKYFLMDNASFHKKAIEVIQKSGNYVLFIPPYSPEFNPIEEVFSHLKTYVRKHITPLQQHPNIKHIVEQYINKQFSTSGYYKHAFGDNNEYD